jgi:peptidoglycan/LPS O-acetylase OafA/YrhL
MSCATSTPLAPPTRMIGLDLLRLLAVTTVLGHHMERAPIDLQPVVKACFDGWYLCGGLGVDLFFVLSGFLVSGLLFAEYQKHGDLSIKQFYLRRGWKIYPPFYFFIAFTFAFQLLVLGEKMRDRPLFSELVFIQSYQAGYWCHTWTLAVEEHFYILLPLLLLFLVRRNPGAGNPFRALPYVVATICVLLPVLRIVNLWARSDYSYITHIFPTHLRIDGLFFGVALGYAYHFHKAAFVRTLQPWRHVLIAGGVALLVLQLTYGINSHFYYHTLGFTHQYLGAAGIFVGTLLCQIPSNFVTVKLAALGAFSYSIYLWHMAISYWAIAKLTELGVSWQLRSLIYFVGAFVIGVAAARIVEIPVLRFRDRMFPSRSTGATLATAPQDNEAIVHRAA